MLGWEQIHAGELLHGYEGHAALPACGNEKARRHADDRFPRTTYVGPMPPPPDAICQTCKTYERDHDPMFQAGREHERKIIREALSREANRIFGQQAKDYPSNVLDTVAWNLTFSTYETLTERK